LFFGQMEIRLKTFQTLRCESASVALLHIAEVLRRHTDRNCGLPKGAVICSSHSLDILAEVHFRNGFHIDTPFA
jgi:hypothetical protein